MEHFFFLQLSEKIDGVSVDVNGNLTVSVTQKRYSHAWVFTFTSNVRKKLHKILIS